MGQGLKKKTKAKAKDVFGGESILSALTIEGRIDEYGSFQDEVEKLQDQIEKKTRALNAQIAEKQDQMATLQAQIVEEGTVNLPGNQKTTVLGKLFEATIGKSKQSRSIKDMKRVAEKVGLDKFFELCSFPLKSADDYLTPEERGECIETTHGGPRTFKVDSRK